MEVILLSCVKDIYIYFSSVSLKMISASELGTGKYIEIWHNKKKIKLNLKKNHKMLFLGLGMYCVVSLC